ncbi:MAG: hypothetical protein R3F29_00550 [Planctomycetota bacterium]
MALASLTLAYVGFGGALSAIGSVLALLGAVVIALFGFVWYPLKRLTRARREKKAEGVDPQAEPGSQPADGASTR